MSVICRFQRTNNKVLEGYSTLRALFMISWLEKSIEHRYLFFMIDSFISLAHIQILQCKI